MFKLPVCPYCHTVYSYSDVRKNHYLKTIECYHCKNEFKQSKIKGYTYLGILIIFVTVLVNIVILNVVSNIVSSLIPVIVVSICAVILAFMLAPFFTSYKAKENIKLKKFPSAEILQNDEKNKRKLKRSVKNRIKKDGGN